MLMNRRAASIHEPAITALPRILCDFCGLAPEGHHILHSLERARKELFANPSVRFLWAAREGLSRQW